MNYQELISHLVKEGYLKTPRLIEAFKKIDRANFVREDDLPEAYVNAPLPIGFGQTISQPLTVAFMIELLQPKSGDKILDVGAGSGWQTAILAEIVGSKGKIFAVEIIKELAEFSRHNIEKYNFISEGRVQVKQGDATAGFLKEAPFDKIIAAAAGEDKIPSAWKEQLKIGGRIVAPIASDIVLLNRENNEDFKEQRFGGFAFVPLVSDEKYGSKHWQKYFNNPEKNP